MSTFQWACIFADLIQVSARHPFALIFSSNYLIAFRRQISLFRLNLVEAIRHTSLKIKLTNVYLFTHSPFLSHNEEVSISSKLIICLSPSISKGNHPEDSGVHIS